MLGMGKNTVEIIIAAKDRTQAAFAKVNTQMKTMGGATGKLNSSMGGLTSKMSSLAKSLNPVMIAAGAAAIALATMGGAAIKASLDFEKASATIRVGTGATGEALAGLEGSFKTVFTAVPTTAANAATAIADLNTRLGLTGKPLEAVATQFLNLSRITGTDVAASISSATRVMHDFAVSSEDQAGALDYLFKVSQSTGIEMTNLANNMTRYGGVMRQMGFDINTSAALLGKFEKEGVNLELVLSSLRMGLANFARAGEEPVEALKRVIAEIQGMGSAADRNLKAIEIFGARSGPDMAAAIYEGRFSIEELMATLDASGETINKAAADALTFGDKWTLAKNNIMAAIEPIGNVILNVLGGAMDAVMKGFSLIKEQFEKFKLAIAPLINLIGDFFNTVSGGHSIIQALKDVVTILIAGLKAWGDIIIWLIKHAIILLVNHIKEIIRVLTIFYNKLGPLKDIIEFVKGAVDKGVEGFHNYAESFREVEKEADNLMDRLDAMIVDIEGVTDKVAEIPKVIVKEWKQAVDAFEAGTGSMKDAISGIDAEINKLKEAWYHADEEERALIEEWVGIYEEQKEALIEQGKIRDEAFSKNIEGLNKAIEKQKEFKVSIGDTTIEFKGMAAEVVKNADAYAKLEASARTLIDLDWATFTEFEASLPRIDAGIGDLESSFVGLKDILEDNIDKLENVKLAVMDISEIAAPFLEKGFLDGIKAIGDFAGALSDAGGAINTFAGLQDVSIEGCINFSMHVRDMVSALEILESQMEDLVPVFGDFDSLITNILETFVWIPGKKETLADEINRIAYAARDGSGDVYDLSEILEEIMKLPVGSGVVFSGMFSEPYVKRYMEGAEDIEDITADLLASEEVLERQFGYTTEALAYQTGQLKKITDALQPYLEFMRTLNELAALSTLSTEELNNGLNAINDTLINLGTSLSTFDLRPVMESLFGTKIAPGEFTGGIAKGFTDVMGEYESEFHGLIVYVERLSSSILSLVSSFEALENISESVLADQKKLKEVFKGITDVMTNFSAEMGGTEGFAQKFAEGMDTMLKSAAPLIKYFQDNNAAIEQFNKSLGLFVSTITNVVSNIQELSTSVKTAADMVIVSSKDMEAALELIPAQLGEIAVFLGGDIWGDTVKGLSAVDFSWKTYAKTVDGSMPAFSSAMDTFSTLTSKILSLSVALKDMRDMTVLSVRDIDEALKNIPIFLDRFVDALALNMSAIKQSLKDLDKEWGKHAEDMKAVKPSYEDSTSQIGKLVGSLLSLGSALKSLAETGIITEREFDVGFKSLMTSISNFAGSLSNNVDNLIYSLQKLRVVWVENEDVLFPLIRDFAIITDNLWGVAHNANRMAEEFSNINKNARTLEEGFTSLIKFINQVVESTKEFYTPEAAAELAGFITDVGKVIDAFVDLEKELNTAMDKIKSAVGNAVDNTETKIKSIDTLTIYMYNSGVNLIQSLINGIAASMPALQAQMNAVTDIIEGNLGVESPTRLGPLRNLDEWPRNLIQSYSAGIEAEMHTLNSSFSGMLASPVSISACGGGSRTVYLSVTQNISDRDTADYANRGLERILQKHEVM